jgi:choloylglycine hydrolase
MSTVFQLRSQNRSYICKNQDVIYDGVYLFTNQKGVVKHSLALPPEQPARWTSEYGSVTITQIGKEFPNGGMNEKGLVVEQTTLWSTVYPMIDSRPAIGELQWIQYMLDTCATVHEVIEFSPSLRIAQSTSKLHYMVSDHSGDCAVIEFIEGEMKVYRGRELPVPAIANSPYREAVASHLTRQAGPMNNDDYEINSQARFATVKQMLQFAGETGQSETDLGFSILNEAKRSDTVYNIIYDMDSLRLLVKKAGASLPLSISLNDLDFSGKSEDLGLELMKRKSETCGEWKPFTLELNNKAVNSFFRDPVLSEVFGWEISDEMIQYFSAFPGMLADQSGKEN